MTVLQIRISSRDKATAFQVKSVRNLRLESNAGAIDENIITQVTAKVGGVVAHVDSMARNITKKQIHDIGSRVGLKLLRFFLS
jgi:hypothetical protein